MTREQSRAAVGRPVQSGRPSSGEWLDRIQQAERDKQAMRARAAGRAEVPAEAPAPPPSSLSGPWSDYLRFGTGGRFLDRSTGRCTRPGCAICGNPPLVNGYAVPASWGTTTSYSWASNTATTIPSYPRDYGTTIPRIGAFATTTVDPAWRESVNARYNRVVPAASFDIGGFNIQPSAPPPMSAQARERARKLLGELLDDEQRRDWLTNGSFTVRASSGAKYKIRQGHVQNVFKLDAQGNTIERLCAHGPGHLVDEDHMVMQKFMLEADEEQFRRTANIDQIALRPPGLAATAMMGGAYANDVRIGDVVNVSASMEVRAPESFVRLTGLTA